MGRSYIAVIASEAKQSRFTCDSNRVAEIASSRFALLAMTVSLRGSARGRDGGDDVVHRGLHAALLVRHAGERERHLGAGERAHHHQLVGVAEMTDAEHLAGERSEARAVGDVEVLERERPEGI